MPKAAPDDHSLLDAMEMIHDLALSGVREAEDPSMEEQAAQQKNAVNIFGDLITNHHEEIEDDFQRKGGTSSIVDHNGKYPEADLGVIRDLCENAGFSDIAICLELAAQQLDDRVETSSDDHLNGGSDGTPHGMDLDTAFDMVCAYFATHGKDLLEEKILMLTTEVY